MKILKFYLKKSLKNVVILVLLTLFISFLSNIIPILSQMVFDEGIMKNNVFNIAVYSSILIGVYIGRGVLNHFSDYLISATSAKIIANVKNEIIQKILKMPVSFFDKQSTAYILSRLNEVNSLSSIFTPTVFNFLSSTISMIGALMYILSKSIEIFVACVSFIPVVYIISNTSITSLNKYSREMLEATANTNNKIHSALEGIIALKELNEEEHMNQSITKEVNQLALKTIHQSKTASKSSQMLNVMVLVVQTLIIGIIGFFITNKKLTIGDYVSMTQYVGMIYSPLIMLQSFKLSIQPAIAAISRINSMLSSNNTENIEESTGKKIDCIKFVKFENVSFKYDTSNESILNNICFDLYSGDRIAFIGKNGSGKTTIAKLLLGFYKNYSGNITINDYELKELDINSLRSKIGIVPQNIYLFEGSVKENIRIGNRVLSEEEFQKRLDRLLEYGFLDGLDLNKKIIDNGKNLSKGQIQQIAFARIFMKDVDVLIFDEATSNMDPNAKEAFQNILLDLLHDKICLFISHTDELMYLVNKKIVLNDGKADIVYYREEIS
ncbi:MULTISPECIES: ABC transporter ATP-binding protein [Anoxybacillaceae]|uniref:ABC transporter ATP-binding protein n=2 Tax=Geobacillus thermodenitrificans TaxID=33940 RepID=A0ABY9QDW3_GEOTD|nr:MULTISPECIES: ABC transporter ATP-binding protein [Bacillaceae]ARP41178.1 Putative multidrug export ATP-binding/permease protein YgaD [Geobacillus thermodenitrificans]KQB94697.1 ABC transporter [Geobacillus sp. PA-3]MED3719119.1 ABC transporter ATP-binding protein [Geobacillus thermodenitrificans]MED4918690.1 ABC transporter ATP-binding protein [Geobacillus thermodenitrificans]WMV76446.1 ABC transporter ATP-binding protein [Geobacillus thermodenitrificans]